MRFLILVLPLAFLWLGIWVLRVYFGALRGGPPPSKRMPAGSELGIAPGAADRYALPLGLLWLATGVVLCASPWALSRDEKPPSFAIAIGTAGLLIGACACLLAALLYSYNRPKFLVLPSMRSQGGRWSRERSRS